MRAGKVELIHEAPDLLEIHDDWQIHMKQRHVDALGSFRKAMHLIGCQDPVKVLPVLLLLQFPDQSRLQPGVIATAGHPCDLGIAPLRRKH